MTQRAGKTARCNFLYIPAETRLYERYNPKDTLFTASGGTVKFMSTQHQAPRVNQRDFEEALRPADTPCVTTPANEEMLGREA